MREQGELPGGRHLLWGACAGLAAVLLGLGAVAVRRPLRLLAPLLACTRLGCTLAAAMLHSSFPEALSPAPAEGAWWAARLLPLYKVHVGTERPLVAVSARHIPALPPVHGVAWPHLQRPSTAGAPTPACSAPPPPAAPQAAPLLVQGLGLPLPLLAHLAVQGAGLGVLLHVARRQCRLECALPHLRQVYQASADIGRAWLGNLLPTIIPSRIDSRFNGEGSCLLVSAWALWALGVLLPTLLLDWSCLHAQWIHPRFRQRLLPAVVVYAGLLVGGAIVGCKAVEILLGKWHLP